MAKAAKKKAAKPLADKHKLFIDAYMDKLNATRAYLFSHPNTKSENAAAVMGHRLLRNAKIRKEINERLSEMTLNPEETLKAISDIANADLNSYFSVTEILVVPKVRKSLHQIMVEIREEIEDADKFIARSGITDKKALELHQQEQEERRMRILKLGIRLERYPDAYQIVDGDPYFKKVAELDLVRLVKDKKAGRIKSYKVTEHGVNVELYPADGALRDMAKVHGLFEKDNNQKGIVINWADNTGE